MRRRTIGGAVCALALLATTFGNPTPAQAGPGFDLSTLNGGLHSGHAEAGGRVNWMVGGTLAQVSIARLADICNGGGDGAGAYLYYQYRSGEFISDWHFSRYADTSGCSDGEIVTDRTFEVRDQWRGVAAVRVRVRECNDPDAGGPQPLACSLNPRDDAISAWKWR